MTVQSLTARSWALQIRQTASMSSNGDSISGTLTRNLTRSRSDGASLNGALQRRASTTWCEPARQKAPRISSRLECIQPAMPMEP